TAINLIFSAPITTTRLRLSFGDDVVRVDEVAAFPPNAGMGYPIGTDVNLHQGRQHRVARTPASSTAPGSMRRSIVDGFVNDTDYWLTDGNGPHTIELDVTDPPETAPPTVRVTTSPMLIGGAHVYSGLSDGSSIVTVGKFQSYDEGSGLWTDIPGSNFANNTSTELEVTFAAPIESARIRFVAGDFGNVIVREIVPLPPRDGLGWPMGTSVTFAEKPDYRDMSDDFFALEPGSIGAALTAGDGGGVTIEANEGVLSQQYQVILTVGTDTYRIRNRATGECLAVDGASQSPGDLVVESPYSALPHQRWRMVGSGAAVQFINAFSGLALSPQSALMGSPLVQQPPDAMDPLQLWTLNFQTHFAKKGNGGFPQNAALFDTQWAYNWGKDGSSYPINVDYWPMQWGSFFWDEWPEQSPEWQRNAEPLMLMGYNEPDAASQSNIPVETGIDMWPRLEAQDLPLLAPAPVGPTNSWITSFMDGVDDEEYRVEYTAVHWYASPNANNFINVLNNTRNTFGRDLIVSEFSVVDWNDTNGWDDDDNYNFFLEVFWRMELLPWVKRYAIFVFTDEPGNNISDNRGEMLYSDGLLTPAGKLFSAWDGDTVIRTDTQYHLHNKGRQQRIAAVPGGMGGGSLSLGTRLDEGDEYRWILEPSAQPGEFIVRSVADGRVFSANGAQLTLQSDTDAGASAVFSNPEAEHGWFFLDSDDTGDRLRMDPGLQMDSPTFTGANVQWRFVPVFQAPPGPPRNVIAQNAGLGEVEISWAEHGFRDLESFAVYRHDSMGSFVLIADDVRGESFIDTVPTPGTYQYAVTAIGDTGESALASAPAIAVSTCPPDFNGDFSVTQQDVLDAINAVDTGLDYNADGQADFFDVLSFLEIFDGDCVSP
ncbi:MAG: glycosyl hydrolase, partial [Planctomycetota bacterium]